MSTPNKFLLWSPVLAGLLLLYVPTLFDLTISAWKSDNQGHGPLIVAIAGYFAWKQLPCALADQQVPKKVLGALSLVFGLLLYMVGRSQGFLYVEAASPVFVLTGVLLVLLGMNSVRAMWFPILFLIFAIPLPNFIVDFLTQPLTQWVSTLTEILLYSVGYPIARSGAILMIGQYQLLVAEACSGLNSMFSLSALGLLYVYALRDAGWIRNGILVASAPAIGFIANIVRVILLVLITYYFGDEVGQGFLHGSSGLFVFVVAVLMLFGLDAALGLALTWRSGRTHREAPLITNPVAADSHSDSSRFSLRAAILVAVALFVAAGLSLYMTPVDADRRIGVNLDALIPKSFGDWGVDPRVVPISMSPDVQSAISDVYDAVIGRTYVNARGDRIMLSVGYTKKQAGKQKPHWQELCYKAQGFEIRQLYRTTAPIAGRAIPVTRMVAMQRDRIEPVTYWLTLGDQVVRDRMDRLVHLLRLSLRREAAEGFLVRISSISDQPAPAYDAHLQFVEALLTSLPEDGAQRLIGRR